MRRSDREITDFDEIITVMKKCDVCRLGMIDGDYAYILPLNFGMRIEDGKPVLYFHGAKEGYKYRLMENNPKVSFEMDCEHRLLMSEEKGSCTMKYDSVMGRGEISFVEEEEKYDALCILMEHYHQEDFTFNRDIIPNTTVFKLTVETVTGKRR